MNNQTPAITCLGLTKTFRDVVALDHLNLEVPAGSIFGFLGTNGAGKTTTIRLMTGLSKPTAGSLKILGLDPMQHEMAVKQSIGYLPQSPRFYGWMTPIEMLDYIGKLHHDSPTQRKQRIQEVLQISGLEKAGKRRIAGFSGGMLQRLGIAQAIYHQPAILLLDEPTSSLDPAGRYEVLELIHSLREQLTVFISSHILEDIQRICDHVAILNTGKLVLQADIDTLLKKTVSNTALVVVDESDQAALTDFAKAVQAQPWTDTCEVQKNSLTVHVNDPAAGKPALLQLCARLNLIPEKLEWVHPTLEDIFLKVSKNHE